MAVDQPALAAIPDGPVSVTFGDEGQILREPSKASPEDMAALAHQSYVAGKLDDAERYARIAANAGVPEAMRLLGAILTLGSDTKGQAEGVAFFQSAARKGDAKSLLALGYLSEQGVGGLKPETAEEYFARARSAGDDEALLAHGELLLTGEGRVVADPARARLLLTQSANAGNVEAMRLLALAHRDGLGGLQDLTQAERWLKLAADQGDGEAAFELGVWYSDVELTAYRPADAVRYFEKAVEKGVARAAALRGVLAKAGHDGEPGSPERAVSWWQRGASQGDGLSQFYLAISLAKGEGIARDYGEAFRLLLKSEAGGPLDTPTETAQRDGLIRAFSTDFGEEKTADFRREALEASGLRLRR
jgi:uncharacterized protein